MNKKTKNNSSDEIFLGGVERCKQEIYDKISDIKELWILQEIHKFIINMTKEGD